MMVVVNVVDPNMAPTTARINRELFYTSHKTYRSAGASPQVATLT